MKRIRKFLSGGAFGAVVASLAPAPAAAYPIDCAILLCLAGGFPASAECAAAKMEVIRRITPIPVEPPLQLWNCPMGLSADVAQAIGMVGVVLGPDGLTPEVRQYRDAIEIYQIAYQYYHSRDEEWESDNTLVGDYNDETGDFFWSRSSYIDGPEWLAEAVGGYRYPVYRTWGRDDRYREIIGYKNGYRSGSRNMSMRAIAMRFQDWEGNYYTEVVHY